MISIRRIAVTAPPLGWFHGIDHALYIMYRDALHELGCEVLDVPVDSFEPLDAGRSARAVKELQDFSPQLAIGLPHGTYALLCRLAPDRHGWRSNVFTDVLDIPTLCRWDHAPWDLAAQSLRRLPAHHRESQGDAHGILRRTLTHPRLLHWSRDSGQSAQMQALGLSVPERTILEWSPSLPAFTARTSTRGEGVGFIGHMYARESRFTSRPIEDLTQRSISDWLAEDNGSSMASTLQAHVDALSSRQRRRLSLTQQDSYYWAFAHRVITIRAQTARRLEVLRGAQSAIHCYGTEPGTPGLPPNLDVRPETFSFGPDLAHAFSRHAITVDVANPAWVHGYSHKPILGFSSGGFMLVERKADFVRNFGEAGTAVSYGDASELDAKVDHFLSHEHERIDIAREIRQRIDEAFSLSDVLERVLEHVSEMLGPPATPALPEASFMRPVRQLLASIRPARPTPARFIRAGGRIDLETLPIPWTAAARIPLSSAARVLSDPVLRVRLQVHAGRIGLALARGRRPSLRNERLVSASGSEDTVDFELPLRAHGHLVIRNAHDGPSKVSILEATLLERAPSR